MSGKSSTSSGRPTTPVPSSRYSPSSAFQLIQRGPLFPVGPPSLGGAALDELLKETIGLDMIIVAGAPLLVEGGLYNCAVVMHRGTIMGIAVKTYLPNYREFYEARQFRPSSDLPVNAIDLCGQRTSP